MTKEHGDEVTPSVLRWRSQYRSVAVVSLLLCFCPFVSLAFVSFQSPSFVTTRPQCIIQLKHKEFQISERLVKILVKSNNVQDDYKDAETDADNDPITQLRLEAEKLRNDVLALEQAKADQIQRENQRLKEEQEAQMMQRVRYSATVPILRPDGSTQEMTVGFPPFFANNTSYIVVKEALLPLGIILGESELFAGAIAVDEVSPDSNGYQADLRVGDLVRGFTACKMQMEQPAWQLLAGGIGRPKTFRYMYAADFRPFEEVMSAMGSNRMDPEGRPVLIVLERQQGDANME